jgi:hypothetical protein
MTPIQEDALYDFLESRIEPFTPEDVIAHIRKHSSQRIGRIASEIAQLINTLNIAFKLDTRKWVTRRGCFEKARFVISPTKMELINGILIPGHRCIPFANSSLMPQEYVFHWKSTEGQRIALTTLEGAPEEFYPYYSIFGEEYAPQYVAKDNPENEDAFNSDPYEDPPEVAIQVLDLRNIYREAAFVPGDRFVVTVTNWKDGIFTLEHSTGQDWTAAELAQWYEVAERGFLESFAQLGPGSSTEEQIAHAYWYGGERMRNVPALSLEDFLYEKTERIETTAYGIESRFWYAGKDIPDSRDLDETVVPLDRTMIEELLFQKKIPISEYVVQSYVRDALFRNDTDLEHVIERIVPPSAGMDKREWGFLAEYIEEYFDTFRETYSLFVDTPMGPVRQRVGELHTAVIDLTIRLQKGEIDPLWLPKHTFIILSQIQIHAASVLEDLNADVPPAEGELETIDNSLDSMIETYEDMKELIDEALDSFRRNNLSLVRSGDAEEDGQIIQISIGGLDVWRRLVIQDTCRLEALHRIIQKVFDWKGTHDFRFIATGGNRPQSKGKIISIVRVKPEGDTELDLGLEIQELNERGITEFSYEYGTQWLVKIILLSRLSLGKDGPRCIAGAGAAPPESIEGPIRFRRYLSSLEQGNLNERWNALQELGQDFDPEAFNLEACNRSLKNSDLKGTTHGAE